MSDKTEIVQNASLASGNTQIGVQNNYSGLTSESAVQIAFLLMKEYYPQFKEEALAELHEMVMKELEKMNPTSLIPPKLKTTLPILQNAAITEETELRRLYAKLLANSLNSETANSVHPSFVSIVNELSAFDAKVLEHLCEKGSNIPLAKVTFDFGDGYLPYALPRYITRAFNDDEDVWQISFSIENLSRLRLVDIFFGVIRGFNYEIIKGHPYIQKRFAQAKLQNPEKILTIRLEEYALQISDFGNTFMRICIPDVDIPVPPSE